MDLKQNEDISREVCKSVVDFDCDSDEEPISESLIKESDFVKVSAFHFTADDQDNFLTYFHAIMEEADFISEGEKIVNTVTLSSDSALIMKIRTSEEANLACLLENVYYLGKQLKISKYAVDGENNVIPVTESKATSSLMDVFDGDGYFIYAQMLIKYRGRFPKTGSHDVIYATIKKKLSRRGVLCSAADLRLKRDRMKKLFIKKKYSSSDEEGSGGTKSEESNGSDSSSDADDLLKFSKVATWSVDAAIDLVDILIEKAEDFHKP